MFDGIFQRPSEIITEISMSCNSSPWLILEGTSDEKFFNSMKYQINKSLRIISVGGRSNVISIVTESEKYQDNVFGIVDRDYHDILENEINYKKIVKTDFRDIETMMFFSLALEKVILEFGSLNKLPKLDAAENIDYKKIRTDVCKQALQIGKFRIYLQKQHKKNSNYSIKFPNPGEKKGKNRYSFKAFFCYKKFMISPTELITHLKGSNNNSSLLNLNEWENAQQVEIPEELNSPKYLCSGHDLMEILGQGFRKKWATREVSNITKEKIESYFRLAYSYEEFSKTEMCKKLLKLLELSE